MDNIYYYECYYAFVGSALQKVRNSVIRIFVLGIIGGYTAAFWYQKVQHKLVSDYILIINYITGDYKLVFHAVYAWYAMYTKTDQEHTITVIHAKFSMQLQVK